MNLNPLICIKTDSFLIFQPPAGFVHTESTTQPPSQPAVRYPEYDEIEIITAPPLGGHRHYGPTYEVQVNNYLVRI